VVKVREECNKEVAILRAKMAAVERKLLQPHNAERVAPPPPPPVAGIGNGGAAGAPNRAQAAVAVAPVAPEGVARRPPLQVVLRPAAAVRAAVPDERKGGMVAAAQARRKTVRRKRSVSVAARLRWRAKRAAALAAAAARRNGGGQQRGRAAAPAIAAVAAIAAPHAAAGVRAIPAPHGGPRVHPARESQVARPPHSYLHSAEGRRDDAGRHASPALQQRPLAADVDRDRRADPRGIVNRELAYGPAPAASENCLNCLSTEHAERDCRARAQCSYCGDLGHRQGRECPFMGGCHRCGDASHRFYNCDALWSTLRGFQSRKRGLEHLHGGRIHVQGMRSAWLPPGRR
jgi:hypothetical protein